MDKNKAKIIKELRNFKEENKISKLIFFGSRIKNMHSKYSDVDLIIISSRFNKIKSFKRAPLIRLKWKLEYPVDMLCYTPGEFNKLKKQVSIVRETVSEGIEI